MKFIYRKIGFHFEYKKWSEKQDLQLLLQPSFQMLRQYKDAVNY